MTETLWREILTEWGVSGFEEPVRNWIAGKVQEFGKVNTDAVGNLWLTMQGKEAESRKIAFIAHLDEIGFVLTQITQRGTAKFRKIGGIDDRILPGQKVEVRTKEGKVLPGVIGIKPPHLILDPQEQQKIIPWHELEIFFGFFEKKHAEDAGLDVLLPGRFRKELLWLNEKYLSCRGLDDRAGCLVLLQLADRLSKQNFRGMVYLIWTVQEEYGLRGAKALSRHYFDEAYIVDTLSIGISPDTPGVSPVEAGKGPVARIIDRLGIASLALYEKAKKIAEAHNIPFQVAVAGGTTDATAMFEGGSPALPIGIPTAFSHSPVEFVDIHDVEHTVKLCTLFALQE